MRSIQRVLDRGHFGLGFMFGLLVLFVVLFSLEYFEASLFGDNAVSGAIVGALVAGGISILGQLFVIIQNERHLEANNKREERAGLEIILTKLNRAFSLFAQLREHSESDDDFNVVKTAGFETLMKPMRVPDLPRGFSESELSLPIRLSDGKFGNLLNVLDSLQRNFCWAYGEYEKRVDLMMRGMQNAQSMKFSDGKFSGVSDISVTEHYELNDLQKLCWSDINTGLLITKSLINITLDHLKKRHGVLLAYSGIVEDEELQNLVARVDLGNMHEDVVKALRL